MSVSVKGLSKAYGGEQALAGLDLEFAPGSFTVICGPPKSGKSVLFRLLVGLEKADGGAIELDGEDITYAPAGSRRLGYVPQSFALYPNLSVRDNIAYPLALAKAPPTEIDSQVERAATMLSITHLLTKTPDQLSGGEKQRTALARGLLKNAEVFVLDDPLVGLDYKLRERLMEDLKDLREELGATFIYATSDSIEALRLASELVVMDIGGEVLQQCAPMQAYRDPASRRVMELLGFPRANLVKVKSENGRAGNGSLDFEAPPGSSGELVAGFRPEAVRLSRAAAASSSWAAVRLVEDLGSELVIYVDLDGEEIACVTDSEGDVYELGDEVGVSVEDGAVRFFSAAGGASVRAGPAD